MIYKYVRLGDRSSMWGLLPALIGDLFGVTSDLWDGLGKIVGDICTMMNQFYFIFGL